jgi:hypothetical protein
MSRVISVEANWDPEADLLEDEAQGEEVEVPFEFCARFSESLRIRSRVG